MKLVKVAQDMAAMNPGKSVAEVMEALEAAKSGDISGLKGFGANVTEADISNMGFKWAVQQKLKPQYSGGAEKLSGTGAGMVSIIKGKLNNKLQDMGLGIIEKLKPALASVIELIDRYSPALDAFGSGIASGIGLAVEWVQKIAGLISEKFGWIGEKSVFLKEVFMVSWGGIQNSLAAAWEFIQPVISLIANGIMLLFNIFQLAFPGIQAVIENVWKFVKPILEGIGTFIGWSADGVGALAEKIGMRNGFSSGGSEGGGGGGAGAFADISEVKKNTMQSDFVNQIKALEAQTPTNTKVQYNNSYAIPKGYESTQKIPGYSGETIMNPQVTVNINGVSLSTQEIASKLVPQIRLALQNISSRTSRHARLGGMTV
ncbi:MAG TPA: hypothetical protein VN549_01930 [Negativicutes bacterium]|nr:hypothetical protein [Negativicutes bacterium]